MILPYEQRCIMRETTMAISFKGAHFPQEVILVVFEIWTFTLPCGMLIPLSGGRCHGPDCCDVSVLSK